MSESAEAATSAADTPGQATPAFRERLYASWWTWPLPLVIAVLLAAEVHMGYPGVRAWLPYVILIPLAILVPLMLGRTKLEVTETPPPDSQSIDEQAAEGTTSDGPTSEGPTGDRELRAGDARLPLHFVDGADIIEPSEKRQALGPKLDPAAFVLHRPWIGPAVRVWLDDEDDPTPYWILSTRRPRKLVDALRSTNSGSSQQPST